MKNTYTIKRLGLKYILLLASALTSSVVYSELKITEIMPSNISTIYSDLYDYNGYVEIYNDGGQVDLNGWTVKNEKEGKENWTVTLNQQHTLQQGYNILFFGSKETNSGSARNVNQSFVGCVPGKLTSDAGKLTLTNGSQTISISYPKQYPHISYCEAGYMIPTPGTENSEAYDIKTRVSAPNFTGTAPGIVYSGNNATVSLSVPTDGAKIYYTTNGGIPTKENGTEYTTPITLDKSTIVRARAYKDGMLYSEISTGSYLFTGDIYTTCGTSNLPVVSICSDNDHFYGDKLGICVKGTNGAPTACSSDMNGNANYNQEWTRPANFEYIIDGNVVDCQEVEVGVFGGCSRSHDVKSFKIKANKRTGNNKFQYTKFFADRSYTKYKSLALRNGGNGWYLYPRWRDGYMQSLTKGMNIDYQAYQPVAYFLNGEYKGLMGLRERTDEDYIYSNYGLDEDEIEYLRVMKDLGKYEAQIGTEDAYNNMDRYAQEHNQDTDFYDNLSQMMDIDEYIDYQIIQQFIGNTDWVNNNIKLWRKKDGGKFRWILFDVDFGMSRHTDVNNNMLLFTTTGNAKDNSTTTNPGGWGGGFGGFGDGISTVDTKFCTLFKSCMANEDFKYKFLDRYTYLLETKLSSERTSFVLDSIAQLTKAEACAMINYKTNSDNNNTGTDPTTPTTPGWGGIGGIGGWPGTGSTGNGLGGGSQNEYDSGIESMRTFGTQRPAIIERQLVSYYSVNETKAKVNIKVSFSGEQSDYSFMVNKIVSNSEYNRNLFVGERLKVEMRVPIGYKIQSWKINDEIKNGTEETYLDIVPSNGVNIEITLAKDNDFKIPNLYINEVCASNGTTEDEYGGKPDWIEIYNNEDYDVDLAGMILRNETTGASSVIPHDYSSTIIPAKGRVLLWADKDPSSGPLHLAFKLSASTAQKIQLLIPLSGREEKIDEVTYQMHDRDGSYGRATDGSSEQKVFPACSASTNGQSVASPFEENGSVRCSYSSLEEVLSDGIVYPNPTNNEWTVNVSGSYVITNISGQVMETGVVNDGNTIGGQLTSGVYLLRIDGNVVKLVKY